MSTKDEALREVFEAWAKAQDWIWTLDRAGSGYFQVAVNGAWLGWCAAWKHVVAELAIEATVCAQQSKEPEA